MTAAAACRQLFAPVGGPSVGQDGGVGTWGFGIFSDDEAADVRDSYREHIADGVDDERAAQLVLEDFQERGARPTLVWLALAASQSQVGRLTPEVKARALELIDDGSELACWPREGQARRHTTLQRLRTRLMSPQPARRPVRREWKPSTDLQPGDVLAVTVRDGTVRVLRTVLVEHTRTGRWPMLELLDYRNQDTPTDAEIAALPPAFRVTPTGNRAGPRRWIVCQDHQGDPTWLESEFTLVTRVHVRQGDDSADTSETWSDWPALRKQLSTLTWFEDGPRPS